MPVYGKYECFVMHMLYVCALCASCSLLILVEDAIGHHMEEEYSRAGPSVYSICYGECFYYFLIILGICACTEML